MANRRFKLTVRTRTALIVSVVVFLSVICANLILINKMTDTYQRELGKRVMAIAQTLAQSPSLREGLQTANGWQEIQPIAERVRLATDVEYVVVFDMNKTRYSDPLEDRIGTPFEDGDEGPALTEQSYISEAHGVKGDAIRSFVPVMDEDGSKQLGVVVVGILVPSFLEVLLNYHTDLYFSLLLGTVLAIIGAVWVANRIKRQMFNMEPDDIAHLFEEREAVIESIAEGIIAIDSEERITVFNQQAAKMMRVSKDVIGKPIQEVIQDSRLPEVLHHGVPQYHQLREIQDSVLLVNRFPIQVNGKTTGAMSMLQDRTEVYQLAQELTGVQKFIDALRAQNHEYLNKLHTILGLIQMQRYDEVIDRIVSFNQEKEAETYFLTERIKDFSVSGLIMGKISHAKEQGVDLLLDKRSSLTTIPANLEKSDLLMLLGNLLENAIYAAAKSTRPHKQVELFLEGNEDGLEIQVSDNGIGIEADIQPKIFDYGFSTKGSGGQGIGLYLVKQLIDFLGGDIQLESRPGEGTRFVVVLPGPDWEMEEKQT
ncbi:ATP-binding protein [Effusibacillus dendaii]|uniref:histidine kinase n=1 Tax=Effusibacillus dendaii TaxID=2743772 RepID=A0A7I8D8F6_9BACL|nr:sensor histidine kinase [Effusibacillus dendaii]BCJ86404.1 histidine kinase [Effusibacillus dendaii]